MQRILSLARTISLGSLANKNINIISSWYGTIQQTTLREKLLAPSIPMINQVCTMKVKGRVHRRCKSCYIVVRDERMYVMCPKSPRHKQMSMKPKPLNTWTLTHASQSPVRPW